MNRIDQDLIEASGDNNVLEARQLLRSGADVEAKDNDGFTPLHRATRNGHVQVSKELVEHGADIEAKDKNSYTPLQWACIRRYLTLVNELRDHGADIETKDKNGFTPLHWASLMDCVAVVNELLSPNERKGATTSLGKWKSRGANTEAKTGGRDGDTPLHLASWGGHLAIVKALLNGGADILAANNTGKLPIHLAVIEGKSDVSKYLLRELYATTRRLPLHELLEDLTWICNPNSDYLDVPLLYAALYHDVLGADDVVEILEYLVARNPAVLSSRGRDGSMPLHVACRRGASFTIVQSLVNLYEASAKSATFEGDSPLFLACDSPEPSLDTIFILMKIYPELVYQ
jgi:ankyrin repeat protein